MFLLRRDVALPKSSSVKCPFRQARPSSAYPLFPSNTSPEPLLIGGHEGRIEVEGGVGNPVPRQYLPVDAVGRLAQSRKTLRPFCPFLGFLLRRSQSPLVSSLGIFSSPSGSRSPFSHSRSLRSERVFPPMTNIRIGKSDQDTGQTPR